MRLNPVTTNILRPVGAKVSDGWSVMGIVAQGTPAINAGELVCLPLDGAATMYFVGTVFEDVALNLAAEQTVAVNIEPGVIETDKFVGVIGDYGVGVPVWFDRTERKITATKSDVFAGVVTEVLASVVRFILVRQPNIPYQMETPIAPAALIADVKADVADIAGADAAALVTDLNKAGGVVLTLNDHGTKINSILAALKVHGIVAAS